MAFWPRNRALIHGNRQIPARFSWHYNCSAAQRDKHVSDQHDEEVQLRVSLETLTRHIAQDCQEQLNALRAGIEQQIKTVEAALKGTNQAVIDTTVKHLS